MNKRLGAVAVVALLAMEGFMLPLVVTNAASGDSVRMSVSTDEYTYPLVGTVTATISVTNLEPETQSGLTINTTVYDPASYWCFLSHRIPRLRLSGEPVLAIARSIRRAVFREIPSPRQTHLQPQGVSVGQNT